MYDPVLGRFVSEDPIRWQAGDVNLYRYAENDPINKVDPTGMFGESPNSTGSSSISNSSDSVSESLGNSSGSTSSSSPSSNSLIDSSLSSSPSSGSSSGNLRPTPRPSLQNMPNGYPKAPPPCNQVTVVLVTSGNHSFVLLIRGNSQTLFFSGRGGVGEPLRVSTGYYGQSPEPYRPGNQYLPLGNYPEGIAQSMIDYMRIVNEAGSLYGITSNNCHSVTTGILQSAGIKLPPSPYPDKQKSPPGYGIPAAGTPER